MAFQGFGIWFGDCVRRSPRARHLLGGVGLVLFSLCAGLGCGSANVKKGDDAGARQDAEEIDSAAPDGPRDAPAGDAYSDGVAVDVARDVAGDAAGDAATTTDAQTDGGSADAGAPTVVLLEGAIVSLGSGAAASGVTLEGDGFEGFGATCSGDGALCLLSGGIEP